MSELEWYAFYRGKMMDRDAVIELWNAKRLNKLHSGDWARDAHGQVAAIAEIRRCPVNMSAVDVMDRMSAAFKKAVAELGEPGKNRTRGTVMYTFTPKPAVNFRVSDSGEVR